MEVLPEPEMRSAQPSRHLLWQAKAKVEAQLAEHLLEGPTPPEGSSCSVSAAFSAAKSASTSSAAKALAMSSL